MPNWSEMSSQLFFLHSSIAHYVTRYMDAQIPWRVYCQIVSLILIFMSSNILTSSSRSWKYFLTNSYLTEAEMIISLLLFRISLNYFFLHYQILSIKTENIPFLILGPAAVWCYEEMFSTTFAHFLLSRDLFGHKWLE